MREKGGHLESKGQRVNPYTLNAIFIPKNLLGVNRISIPDQISKFSKSTLRFSKAIMHTTFIEGDFLANRRVRIFSNWLSVVTKKYTFG